MRGNGDASCSPTSLDANGFRILPSNFRISSTFSVHLPTLRLLDLFLLQTCCAKMLTSLRNAQ